MSQFVSFDTSATNDPSARNVNTTRVCSKSWAESGTSAASRKLTIKHRTAVFPLEAEFCRRRRSKVGVSYRRMLSVLLVILLQASSSKRVDIVSVTGCLRETTPGAWMLTSATDPIPGSANAPRAGEIPTTVPTGRNEFRLIGVSEFNLPAYKGQTVIVKGLYIKAEPVSRLNITSVTTVAPTCAAPPAR